MTKLSLIWGIALPLLLLGACSNSSAYNTSSPNVPESNIEVLPNDELPIEDTPEKTIASAQNSEDTIFDIYTVDDLMPPPIGIRLYCNSEITEIAPEDNFFAEIFDITRAQISADGLAQASVAVVEADEFSKQLETGTWLELLYSEPRSGTIYFMQKPYKETEFFLTYHRESILFPLKDAPNIGGFYFMPGQHYTGPIVSADAILAVLDNVQ